MTAPVIRAVVKLADFTPAVFTYPNRQSFGPYSCYFPLISDGLLYAMGGDDSAPLSDKDVNPAADPPDPLTGPYRFADKAFVFEPDGEGGWLTARQIIGKGSFSWM